MFLWTAIERESGRRLFRTGPSHGMGCGVRRNGTVFWYMEDLRPGCDPRETYIDKMRRQEVREEIEEAGGYVR